MGVHLVNLHHTETRRVVVQAGALAEHAFRNVCYDTTDTPYPGATGAYAAPQARVRTEAMEIDGSRLLVVMPPATRIHLDLETARYVNRPRYESA